MAIYRETDRVIDVRRDPEFRGDWSIWCRSDKCGVRLSPEWFAQSLWHRNCDTSTRSLILPAFRISWRGNNHITQYRV